MPSPADPIRDQYRLNSNDRLLAALGYAFWIVAVVVALMTETKSKPLLKDHAVQGIGFAVASLGFYTVSGIVYVCATILTFGLLGLVLWVMFLVPGAIGLYFGYIAYGEDNLTEIPFLTDFMTEQGWFETRPPV